MNTSSVELQTATVKARRALVEVKPDRTVFNVEGTINSTGDNGLGLLRKAPGVQLDNNNSVSVLGRSGVIFYVDGKRLPLSGDELTAYLESLPAEQIDRMEIITNPGARYEAEGNAGIIDIRLKKDKSLGFNGSASLTYSKGRKARTNASVLGNYRNKNFNTFGSVGYDWGNYNQLVYFDSYQNDFRLLGKSDFLEQRQGINYRLGTDFFISEKSTIGFLVNGGNGTGDFGNVNTNVISSNTNVDFFDTTPDDVVIPEEDIDSTLVAENVGEATRNRISLNLNYLYQNEDKVITLDADYGRFDNQRQSRQPNSYFDENDELINYSGFFFDTPIQIDIATLKGDYEQDIGEGKFGTGFKLSNVSTENSFLFNNEIGTGNFILSNPDSYDFLYDETVYAAYVNYAGAISPKWKYSAGVRAEQTNTTSDLNAFSPEFEEEPRDSSYLSFFPSAGLTYQAGMQSVFSLNYGRRINRPDYNVLNPFRSQISELEFANGNPALKPEIVNNIELGWTYKYRYNFKISYSKTQNQITRLIGIDDSDPKASFINWDNLAEQNVIGLNISLPIQVMEKWSAYINLYASHLDNQATYPNGNVIDLQAFNYGFYQQHTINLPKGFIGEVSGWFSGPGIWGGVFEYETSWALNLGLQKKFLDDKLNVKLSVNDVFNQAFWSGFSNFDQLLSYGTGNWDSRRGNLSISYKFGNDSVKKARDRKTGLEDESSRVGEGSGQQ